MGSAINSIPMFTLFRCPPEIPRVSYHNSKMQMFDIIVRIELIQLALY